MVRALIIIMVATFVLALGCFAGAAAIGGREFAEKGWVWPDKWGEFYVHVSDDDHDDGDHHPGSRDLAWSGGEVLQIDVPARVVFVQDDNARVTVRGPSAIIDRIVLEDGRLMFSEGEGPANKSDRGRIVVTINAPGVKRFVLNGSPELDIMNFDQPELDVQVNGSGDVEGTGRAGKIVLGIAGSGDADLSGVESPEAVVNLAGSGDARVAPRDTARVTIAGSGNVLLASRPATVTSDIGGSGDLRYDD